jgi:hypothetical protein
MRAEIKLGTADEVTRRRFNHALHYLLNNGTFPNPVSGMMVGDRRIWENPRRAESRETAKLAAPRRPYVFPSRPTARQRRSSSRMGRGQVVRQRILIPPHNLRKRSKSGVF